MDYDGIGKQVRYIFQISCINLSRCLKCNEMQGNCTLQNTLNIPIIQLPRSQNTDLESLLKHYSTSEVRISNTRTQIDNIETPSLPDSQWLLTQEEEQEIKGIFISQTDEDL